MQGHPYCATQGPFCQVRGDNLWGSDGRGGIDNPIGLKLKFYTDDDGRCIARFRPKPEHQEYPGQLHGGLLAHCWTSQLRFQGTLTLGRYD